MRNLNYPEIAVETAREGKAYIKFVVSDKGKISNLKVMKGVANCPECDKEAVRVIKAMPDWIPGKIGGKAVSSYFVLPIVFKLD